MKLLSSSDLNSSYEKVNIKCKFLTIIKAIVRKRIKTVFPEVKLKRYTSLENKSSDYNDDKKKSSKYVMIRSFILDYLLLKIRSIKKNSSTKNIPSVALKSKPKKAKKNNSSTKLSQQKHILALRRMRYAKLICLYKHLLTLMIYAMNKF